MFLQKMYFSFFSATLGPQHLNPIIAFLFFSLYFFLLFVLAISHFILLVFQLLLAFASFCTPHTQTPHDISIKRPFQTLSGFLILLFSICFLFPSFTSCALCYLTLQQMLTYFEMLLILYFT